MVALSPFNLKDIIMKRLFFTLPLATLVLFAPLHADTLKEPKKVIIDRSTLKRDSKDGKLFEKTKEQELAKFREFAALKEKEISLLEQSIFKKHQQGELSPVDLQDEMANVERLKRRAGLEIDDKKYEISAKLQRTENELEKKILNSIPTIAQKNNWTEVKDTQGNVLYAANILDKTSDVLDAINKAFEKETAKATLTAQTTTPVKATATKA